ncbi:MAG: class I SAM-dependent methyltransferase, partial [Verrucomicrobiota bacterium]
QPNASWLLADFQAPASGLARFRARLILKSMYAFFRVVTRLPANRLTPPEEFLRSHGFKLLEHRESDWGLLRSDLWKR